MLSRPAPGTRRLLSPRRQDDLRVRCLAWLHLVCREQHLSDTSLATGPRHGARPRALRRTARRSGRGPNQHSIGRRWRLPQHEDCGQHISFTLSGYLSGRLSVWVESFVTSNSSYGKPAGSWPTGAKLTHGGWMTFVLAIQPS